MRKKHIILFVLLVCFFMGLSYNDGYALDDESEATFEDEIGYDQIESNSSSITRVNRPDLEINWDIQLMPNYKRGFIVRTNNKTGNLTLRTADGSIAEAEVVDRNDPRGYYCEIVGKRAGSTKLIAEDSGTIIEKDVTVSGPNLEIGWDIQLIPNYKRGFIVRTNNKTGNLTLRTADGSIAEAEVVDRNDPRGYYCEIVGKRAGSTKLIAEDSGTRLEKDITVSELKPTLEIGWDIQLIPNYKRGFIVRTNNKTGNLTLRTADGSIAEAEVVDRNDPRGYYCEIVGKRAGSTKLIAEDSGTIIEKDVTVSGPTLNINWDIQLIPNYKRGFIVRTNNKTGNLTLRTADGSIAEAEVVDRNDPRGYYCEIVGKRAGSTKLIAEDSGTRLEKDITVSGPKLEINWDIDLVPSYKRGFIVRTNNKTGNLTLRTADGSIAEAEVVDRNDPRGYYCEIVGKRAGRTKLIAEDSGTILTKDVTVQGPVVGVDVSVWQGDINWSEVKKDGISFVMARIGYGWGPNQHDKYFEKNYYGAKSQGMLVGGYYYSYATNVEQAIEEARYCLKILNGRHMDLPIAYDVEDKVQSKMSKTELSNMIVAFCNEIRRAGYKSMIYSNLNWLTNRLDYNIISNHDIWLAQWNYKPTYNKPFAMWQYTSSGKVRGINGRVDMNYMY